MESVQAWPLGAVLIAAALGLTVWHRRSWTEAKAAEEDQRTLLFSRRQYRRRMQITVMLGLVGLGLVIGAFIPRTSPNVFVLYWSGMMLLVLWMAVLALGDIVSMRNYLRDLDRDRLVEEAKLRAELRRTGQSSPTRNGGVSDGHNDPSA